MAFQEIYEKAVQDLLKVYHKKIENEMSLICDRVYSNLFYEFSRNSMYYLGPNQILVERFYAKDRGKKKDITYQVPTENAVQTIRNFQKFLDDLNGKAPEMIGEYSDVIEQYKQSLSHPETESVTVPAYFIKTEDGRECQMIDLSEQKFSDELLRYTCKAAIDQAVSSYRFYRHDLSIYSIDILEIEEQSFHDIIIRVS